MPIQFFSVPQRGLARAVALSLAAAGCASVSPYAVHRPGGYSGVQWAASGGNNPLPPYPESAKAAGVAGDVTFALILKDPGAIYPGTLTVLDVSDPRILEFACSWMKQTLFSPTVNHVEANTSGVTAIAIRYAPGAATGQLVDPGAEAWGTVQTIKSASDMAAIRRAKPQCP